MLKVTELTDPKYGKPKDKQHALIQGITAAHIDSFNLFVSEGVERIVKHLDPHEFQLEGKGLQEPLRVTIEIKKIVIGAPKVTSANKLVGNSRLFPSECRQRRGNYVGNVDIVIAFHCSNGEHGVFERNVGTIPIMIKSSLCNLANLNPASLIARGEEEEEMGGYFVINGNEKVVRLLIQQRRNYPYCLKRRSWKKRGPEFTEYGVVIRCVREDETQCNLTMHYLQSGSVKLAFGYNKEMFFIPLVIVLKGLVDVSDKNIFDVLMQGREEDTFYKSCIIFMLRQVLLEGLNSRLSVLRRIGGAFRVKLNFLPPWWTDQAVGEYVLKNCICIHLDNPVDKFNMLVFMTKKLFSLVNGECSVEPPDSPMLHEVLTPGQLMQMLLKEKLESWLISCKSALSKYAEKKKMAFRGNTADMKDGLRLTLTVSRPLQYLISTGTLVSNSGLGLQQYRGLTIVADKLNFARYVSHFRAVHRGTFFQDSQDTSVRKLLPEAWGFLCPVHTPDGTPCGLLNHMAANCKITANSFPFDKLQCLLIELGVSPVSSPIPWPHSESYTVVLDGCIVGYINGWSVNTLVSTLRVLKVKGKGEVPPNLEICLVPKTGAASQYPGVFLFSSVARFIRPVHNLNANAIELIGSFEQVYLDVALNPKEVEPGVTTHSELNEHGILSVVAGLTPYSDFNQSPRNMYQCQMGKQTMGTPLHSYPYRADNKLYRIQTPQSPLVRPRLYDTYGCDEYPLGTNTVVAVISYTGYDMEDAMILNKSSFDRGFAHGCIIKSENINLAEFEDRSANIFSKDPNDTKSDLDPDGLPHIGTKLTKGDPYYSYLNANTGDYKLVRFQGQEDAYILQIKICGSEIGETALNQVCFVLRIERNPTIGDKFSSRHGQKGICSMLWPCADMPFTESGMVPDIIFNPHGFPSRMTIGMMIESMAGKSGALHGMYFDATPFMFSEDQPAIDYYGQILTAGGYNYHGTERLYSGITGQEMEADIYVGIIYYQRLRHMVSDKFQVRSTGPVNQLTQQPVKGRKKGGGVRFGEMERDALITHGSSFLLQDRLFNCSDKSKTYICTGCQSIMSPLFVKNADEEVRALNAKFERQIICQHCHKRENIQEISIPFTFRYLAAELASVGIKINIDVKTNLA